MDKSFNIIFSQKYSIRIINEILVSLLFEKIVMSNIDIDFNYNFLDYTNSDRGK